jgi:hypothetical protein
MSNLSLLSNSESEDWELEGDAITNDDQEDERDAVTDDG